MDMVLSRSPARKAMHVWDILWGPGPLDTLMSSRLASCHNMDPMLIVGDGRGSGTFPVSCPLYSMLSSEQTPSWYSSMQPWLVNCVRFFVQLAAFGPWFMVGTDGTSG